MPSEDLQFKLLPPEGFLEEWKSTPPQRRVYDRICSYAVDGYCCFMNENGEHIVCYKPERDESV